MCLLLLVVCATVSTTLLSEVKNVLETRTKFCVFNETVKTVISSSDGQPINLQSKLWKIIARSELIIT